MATTDGAHDTDTMSWQPAGGRHRRNDLPPDGILAEAVRAWRTRRGRRRPPGSTAVTGSAPTPQPADGSPSLS